MIATITDNHYIYIDQLTPSEENVLIKAFSVKDPRAARMNLSGPYDGWYRKYNQKHKRLSRALLAELRAACQSHDIPLVVVDKREYPQSIPDINDVTKDMLTGIVLEDYQIRCIKAACTAEVGLISASTGSGKGEIIAGITKIMKCNTAIIAEQLIVIDQLKERLELREVVDEAGLFCYGKRPDGHQVIIGSIQSLAGPGVEPAKLKTDTPDKYAKKMKAYHTRRNNASMLRKLIGQCDLLLVDEADLAVNKVYNNLFRHWYHGRRKYGLSGSCFDPSKPVENLTLKENLGSIIVEVDRSEVEDCGRIVPIKYCAIGFGDPKNKNSKEAFDIAVDEKIVYNSVLHDLVAKLAIKSTENGGVLILVERKELGYALEKLIEGSAFICGDTSKSKRNAIIEKFESRELKILIGGKITKRGMDLAGGCETMILVTGGKLFSDFKQKLGRAVRINKSGYAIVYDFIFFDNYYLYDHSKQHLKAIVNLGYDACVLYDGKMFNAVDVVNSKFRQLAKK